MHKIIKASSAKWPTCTHNNACSNNENLDFTSNRKLSHVCMEAISKNFYLLVLQDVDGLSVGSALALEASLDSA